MVKIEISANIISTLEIIIILLIFANLIANSVYFVKNIMKILKPLYEEDRPNLTGLRHVKCNKYRIMVVMKVEKDIASIRASPVGWAVIMYVETFKSDNIVFIGNIYNVFDITLTDNFQYQSVD